VTHWIEIEIARWSERCRTGGRLLDVGCGLRPYEKYFPKQIYVGLDAGRSGRSATEKRADVYYDGARFPFDDSTFDVVLFTEVLEHCREPDAVFGGIVRVLAPGGIVLLTVPFIWGEHETPFDFQRYTLYGVEEIFTRHGLRMLEGKRLMPGVDAVETIVRSEIAAYKHRRSAHERADSGWQRRYLEHIAARLWRVQLQLWRRLYRFERIYLDNFVVAEKAATPH
jgi:SAM-dependent methyltransferase